MAMKTYLSEIFSSIQGEGPYVGERHLFLRFCDCHRACLFCDTPFARTATVMVEMQPGAGMTTTRPNPMNVPQLVELIHAINKGSHNRRLSLTGGSPLLQADYLRELLPILHDEGQSIYLETTGDLPRKLQSVIEWIDIVAMDVKLASVTGEPANFPAHWQCLRLCKEREVEVFVKLVLSDTTDEAELMQAVEGIKQAGGGETLVVIQPMSATSKCAAVPDNRQLLRWQDLIAARLPNVRLIPQTHKIMEML